MYLEFTKFIVEVLSEERQVKEMKGCLFRRRAPVTIAGVSQSFIMQTKLGL